MEEALELIRQIRRNLAGIQLNLDKVPEPRK